MKLTLKIWRQKDSKSKGQFKTYKLDNVSADMSFIEMLDLLNEKLSGENEEPIAFDCDCLEGICGACSLMINGVAHGPEGRTTTCQLHMRKFNDGDTIVIEPWRAKPFPVIKDLAVDRTAFDRIIQAGGFVSVNTGGAPDANAVLIPKEFADIAMDAAECIGCGACVASCKNGSAMLFVSAKVSQLASLPQGQPERTRRAKRMVEVMDEEGFGNCTNQYECQAVCPKGIDVKFIAQLNREYLKASVTSKE
jgi:succinate dehydrogenase / fumarate reductase iron-sulfur subunit